MKKSKFNYWYFLLSVFFVVYIGAFLFFRSTADSRLSFYGDIINASGTFFGVLVAYFIMRIEIRNNKHERERKEEKEIVSQIQDEFNEIQKSQLTLDLEFMKKFNNDTNPIEYQFLRKRLLKDEGKIYAEIASHYISISGLSNRLPQKINLIDVCDELLSGWKDFYVTILTVVAIDILPGLQQVNSDKISNSANKLLEVNNNMNEQLKNFFIQNRNDD